MKFRAAEQSVVFTGTLAPGAQTAVTYQVVEAQ
jgi:hypothetical protein